MLCRCGQECFCERHLFAGFSRFSRLSSRKHRLCVNSRAKGAANIHSHSCLFIIQFIAVQKNLPSSCQEFELVWRLESDCFHRNVADNVATVILVNQLRDAPTAMVIGTPVASINFPNPRSSFQTVNRARTYLVTAAKGKGKEISVDWAELPTL